MAPNFILYAIPIFFLLIGVEVWYAKRQKRRLYRFNDAIADLNCGIGERVGGAFTRAVSIGVYVWIYDSLRLLTLPDAAWVFVLGFIGYDFCYYWLHRMSHEVNILWAGHAPHHQSEEYNLAVALRQGLFQSPLTAPFYWPLALLGISPLVFLVTGQFVTLYQFWIHTRAINKMGAFEVIFNTPSHHRVHHGKNPKYLDRNHAGTFIIWDKLFGTFQPEEEEVVYGTIQPLASWNSVWAQIQYFIYLAKLGWSSPNRLDLLRVWFKEPGWKPEEGFVAPTIENIGPSFYQKYETRVPKALNWYVFVQFVVVLAMGVVFLILNNHWPLWLSAGYAALVFWGLLGIGAVLELRRWAIAVEASRFVVLTAVAYLWGGLVQGSVTALLAVVFCAWILRYREDFVTQTHDADPALKHSSSDSKTVLA